MHHLLCPVKVTSHTDRNTLKRHQLIMETKRTADHSEDGESSMRRLDKRSNGDITIALNEEDTLKRKKIELNHDNGRVEVRVVDLPTEMLETILRNVATSDLLNCRLVNNQWNEISSNIMCQRADIQIAFSFQNGRLMQHRDGQGMKSSKSMSFGDLIECLKQSTHFPFSSFRFQDVRERDNMECFLAIRGQNIYELNATVIVENDIEMMRGLLSATPNLRKLNINFGHNWSGMQETAPAVHLFDDSNVFKLSKLNELIVQNMNKKDYGVVADVLKAASNLDSFEKLTRNYDNDGWAIDSIAGEEVAMLQSVDKLHCLKRVSLSFDELLASFLENSPQFLNIRFKQIILSMNKMFSAYTSKDAEIVSRLFDASKNSLFELLISPLECLPGVVLPKFENLEKLTLSHDVHDGRFMFPPHFDMTDNFPNLRELVVDICIKDLYFSTYQPLNVMPKVEYLEIHGDCMHDDKLMKMTPNVKTLLIEGEEDELPNMSYGSIATRLTKLENLKWHFYAGSQHELQSSGELDAMITGFPAKFCKKMSEHLRYKEKLSAKEIDSYETKRQDFSLLDLTGLKRFDIKLTLRRDYYKRKGSKCSTCDDSDCECSTDDDEKSESVDDDESCDMAESLDDDEMAESLDDDEMAESVDDDEMAESVDDDESCDTAGFLRGSIFYKTGLTKVSKLLAFDLMPNLETSIQVLFK